LGQKLKLMLTVELRPGQKKAFLDHLEQELDISRDGEKDCKHIKSWKMEEEV
jgi:hypothetical protein